MGDGTISVVVPTYNVATYLPEFLHSIQTQRGGLDDVDFIFVDDGSPDASVDIITSWMSANPGITATLVRKPNGGLSSARNAGLEAATGTWVTFCDPDDVLSRDYFAEMTSFTSSSRADHTQLVAGRFVFLMDETGEHVDRHPLRFRFTKGTRVVDLRSLPHFIHVAANTGLFRRAVLEQYGLRFDESVRPVWEDGHLTARYLSKFDSPRIAMMDKAVYYYRRRLDGSSLMQGQWTDPRKFVDVPRNGWLDALRTSAAEHDGRAPTWIQNMVLYDVMGYFREERRSPSPTANTATAVSAEFFEILREVFTFIDLDVLDGFSMNFVDVEIREVLRRYFKGCTAAADQVFVDRYDEAQSLVRVHWFDSAEHSAAQFSVDGESVTPRLAKTRPCSFYGHTLAYERTAWLPATAVLALTFDGRPAALRFGPPETRRLQLTPTQLWRGFTDRPLSERPRPVRAGWRARAGRARRRVLNRVDRWRGEQLYVRTTRALAASPWARMRYRNAWLLMDRDSLAQDNAEHLYRWLRAHRRRVNAWFVLDPSSPDWPRLRRQGFRLIPHGSRRHHIALLNCEHLLSSQIDNYVTEPLPAAVWGAGAGSWRYTFLQHGVTKDDLSIWINPKPIELMITATPDEQHSIVSDASPYIWGEREVKMTGFPRHDRLLESARSAEARDPELVLVMPTWRRSLLGDTVSGGNDRTLREGFWETEYASQWRRVLESDQLHSAMDANGYRLVFIPHPNMARYLDNSPLPDHVDVRRFADVDIQQVLSQGAVLVTDYSSLAFEMAYIERPVVYFQFDQTEFFSGTHAYRRGSWSYEDDGFGPVTTDANDAVDAITEIIAREGSPDPVYQKRMAVTFPLRDGKCCERTYEAVAATTRPVTGGELYVRTAADEAAATAGRQRG